MKYVLFSAFMISSMLAGATHLSNGYIQYTILKSSPDSVRYEVELVLWTSCESPVTGDNEIKIGIYRNNATQDLYDSLKVYLSELKRISRFNCPWTDSLCLVKAFYRFAVDLPRSVLGYHLAYIRCCRSPSDNLDAAPDGLAYQGMTIHSYIPPYPLTNNSAKPAVPPHFRTGSGNAWFFYPLYDPDNDSLSFYFPIPVQGGTRILIDRLTDRLTLDNVTYAAGYSSANPFGSGGTVQYADDRLVFSGLTHGNYYFAMGVNEWRDGNLAGNSVYDFMVHIDTAAETINYTVPKDLSAFLREDRKVRLNWTFCDTAGRQFDIEEQLDSGSFNKIGSVASPGSTFLTTQKTGTANHTYRLAVYDASLQFIGYSNLASVKLYNWLSVDESTQTEDIRVFPNPTHDILQILGPAEDIVSLEIYDPAGFLVLKQESGASRADLTDLQNGIYLVKITLARHTTILKVIKY